MSDLPLFLGRFHPALVHLPIGLLVAAGALQAWVWGRRRNGDTRRLDFAIGVLLGVAAAGAVVAAGAGVLLGSGGGYSGALLERHRLLGLGLSHGRSAYPTSPRPRREMIHSMLDAASSFDH